MKKSWFYSLALGLGLLGMTNAFGQYPNAYNNFGPSSFPVQAQPQMQSVLQNLPQVPLNYNAQPAMNAPAYGAQYQNVPYQTVSAQAQEAEPVYGQPIPNGGPQVQQHVPPSAGPGMAQGYGTQPGGQGSAAVPSMDYSSQSPGANYGYQQAIAPNCNNCGNAPISNMYGTGQPLVGSEPWGRNLVGGGFDRVHTFAGLPQGAKPWFFGGGALIFHRVDDQRVPLSFADADYAPDILTTRDARMGASGGFEVMTGRYFNCGRNAIQASYWGLFPNDETVTRSRTVGGDYASRIPFGYMTMAGTPLVPAVPYGVYDWYDNAFAHQLTRSSQYHNVEVNLLGFAVGCSARNFNRPTCGSLFSGFKGGHGSACGYCGGAGCGHCAPAHGACAPQRYATGPCCLTAPACGSRLNLTWLGGFRYFRFSDNLLYSASLYDGVINRSADDLYYEVNTTNDLVGFQIGSRADYCLGQRFNLYGTAKVGVYNNHSTMYSRLGTDAADAYLNDTRPPVNPSNGIAYRFDESQNDVAFLSELGTGLGYRVSPKWTATVGYRAVIASGVATSVDNIRLTHANYADVRDFDNRGTLILHGINIGGLYNF